MIEHVDQSIIQCKSGEVTGIWTLLICDASNVASLDRAFIFAHGNAAVVYLLLKDSWRKINIKCRVNDMRSILISHTSQLIVLVHDIICNI